MITAIDFLTHQASAAYEAFIKDLRGEYASMLSAINPALPAAQRGFELVATESAQARLEQYRAAVTDATDQVVALAIGEQFSDSEHLAVMTDAVRQSLSRNLELSVGSVVQLANAQAIKDIEHGKQQLRTLSFDVATTMPRAGIQNAIKGAVVKNVVGNSNYVAKNGKEWPSIRNVRLNTRHHLLTIYNETVILLASKLGENHFQVKNEEGHRYTGLVFTLNGEADLPAYEQIRKEVFHPNAKSLVYRKK